MVQRGFAGPDDVANLTEIVDAHCEKYHIHDERDREAVAIRALHIFQSGTSAAMIAAELARGSDPHLRG